jgi:hypothetical protein
MRQLLKLAKSKANFHFFQEKSRFFINFIFLVIFKILAEFVGFFGLNHLYPFHIKTNHLMTDSPVFKSHDCFLTTGHPKMANSIFLAPVCQWNKPLILLLIEN